MIARCYNPNNAAYNRYGGRGITVCKRWRKFENFLADMGNRPSSKYSIDRIDNSGNYTRENCKWSTMKEQCRNRRNNRLLTLNGETHCVAEWVDIVGIRSDTIRARLKRGWSVERALHK